MENTKKKDIFDRIMGWGFLKTFEPFYKKNKEILLYLFFGGLTTIVGLIFFILPSKFAYITNRIWVFENKAHTSKGIAKECLSFYGGRLLTLLIENLLLNLCVESINMNDIVAKVLVSIVTIILNYIISKLFVFKKQK